ncbi:hypothetical protein BT96DRAFT_748341, partial [Gymnopus androsaceus JB14]
GHFAKECKNDGDICARCAGPHRTSTCSAGPDALKCVTCDRVGHAASDWNCPSFTQRMASLRARKAGTKYKYFVTEDPETW